MSVQEQAVQMINSLSDDNVMYLIDFMKRFMLPKDEQNLDFAEKREKSIDIMQEMENMRIRAKAYFPADFDSDKIWEEAIYDKYGSAD